jgi:CBS-domain-containing membrane protein
MGTKQHSWLDLLGIELTPVSHHERLVSTLGGFLGILGILGISHFFLGDPAALLIVASMGASAVLLFAVPHGALAQPWAVLGGHTVSALVGVSCALLVPHELLAASLAVGLSIGAMYYLRCTHPPGGATALFAVIGGDTIHSLGYQYVLTPVMLNAVVLVLVAFLFNYAFPWRRYPAYLAFRNQEQQAGTATEGYSPIAHADLVSALSQIDSFIDVTEHDLLRIYELATGKAQQRCFPMEKIHPGHFYSNNKYGDEWSVRQVVDHSPSEDPAKDMLVYKVIAGKGRRSPAVVTRSEFARWAENEVVRDEENWKRVPEDE